MTRAHVRVPSTLGELTLVRTGDALSGVYFRHHWYRPAAASLGVAVTPGVDPLLSAAADQVSDYLAGGRQTFDLVTRLAGTAEQLAVWQSLSTIGYGRTTSYGAIGRALGLPAQQVGAIVGRNPLSIVVPCHRVVGADGRLTGYAGGLARKRALLELEGALTPEPEQLTLHLV